MSPGPRNRGSGRASASLPRARRRPRGLAGPRPGGKPGEPAPRTLAHPLRPRRRSPPGQGPAGSLRNRPLAHRRGRPWPDHGPPALPLPRIGRMAGGTKGIAHERMGQGLLGDDRGLRDLGPVADLLSRAGRRAHRRGAGASHHLVAGAVPGHPGRPGPVGPAARRPERPPAGADRLCGADRLDQLGHVHLGGAVRPRRAKLAWLLHLSPGRGGDGGAVLRRKPDPRAGAGGPAGGAGGGRC